jgi:putative transposase
MRTQIQQWLQQLLDEEVTEFLGRAKAERRAQGAPARLYRNGHGKPRQVSLLSGTVMVRRPRVRGVADQRFESRLLPFFKKQTPEVGELLHQGYLHGMATGDFELAFRHLLGDGAPLSRAGLVQLTERWQRDYDAWRARALDGLELVYLWADGVYVKAGLEREKAALLVLIGALSDGSKTVLAVESGERESAESWARVLRDLKARGLRAPKLTIGDGHLGLWGALAEIYPESAEQRCWLHKLLNVLDRVPLKAQEEVKGWLKQLMYPESRAACERLKARFAARYAKRFPDAVATLERDWPRLVTYFDFPREHWKHLRTTNVVESPFAAVRLRTSPAKRFKRVGRAVALIWKVLCVAERQFKLLATPSRCTEVFHGVRFIDGDPAPLSQMSTLSPSREDAAA